MKHAPHRQPFHKHLHLISHFLGWKGDIVSFQQDLPGSISAEDVARYLDPKELDERLYMFQAVSAHDGWVKTTSLKEMHTILRTSKLSWCRIRHLYVPEILLSFHCKLDLLWWSCSRSSINLTSCTHDGDKIRHRLVGGGHGKKQANRNIKSTGRCSGTCLALPLYLVSKNF